MAKTVEEINRIKGFQYILANILEECDIVSKEELNRLAAERYSSAMAKEIKRFLNTKLPALDKEITESMRAFTDLGDLFDTFENMHFDNEGKPKAKA